MSVVRGRLVYWRSRHTQHRPRARSALLLPPAESALQSLRSEGYLPPPLVPCQQCNRTIHNRRTIATGEWSESERRQRLPPTSSTVCKSPLLLMRPFSGVFCVCSCVLLVGNIGLSYVNICDGVLMLFCFFICFAEFQFNACTFLTFECMGSQLVQFVSLILFSACCRGLSFCPDTSCAVSMSSIQHVSSACQFLYSFSFRMSVWAFVWGLRIEYLSE